MQKMDFFFLTGPLLSLILDNPALCTPLSSDQSRTLNNNPPSFYPSLPKLKLPDINFLHVSNQPRIASASI